MRVLAVTSHSDRPEAETFIGLSEMGVHVEVMCPDDAPHREKFLNADIPVHTLSLRGRFDRRGCEKIKKHLVDGGFDLIHTFNNAAVSNGLRASRGAGVKFIAYRGIAGNESVYDPMSWTTYLHPRVDKIICVAEAVRQSFLRLRCPGWRFPADRAVTIHKGHDLSWYPEPTISRNELGIPEDAFVVGCTANERPRKGLQLLIEAASSLSREPDLHLVLIGSVSLKKTLRKIATSPMRERIHLTGFRTDAPQVLAMCDVCILPALKREGLPKGIIEGMVYGLAPIVTNSGGSPELIEPGVSGLVIPPGSVEAIAEAIRVLHSDRKGCAAMGTAARRRIDQHFNIRDTVRQTFDLYTALVSQSDLGERRIR